MLAIPVFRSRVAPVLNWCSRVFIISEDAAGEMQGRELILDEMNGFERLRALREEGVNILICGALSPDLFSYGRVLGLHIIPGVAGFIDEVLAAFRERKLDQPHLRLPGCPRARHYRSGGRCCETISGATDTLKKEPSGAGREREHGKAKRCPMENRKAGSVGGCVCPRCGAELPE